VRTRSQPAPPPPGHDFNRDGDPLPLAARLARLRHEEWKRTSVGDGRGAAEAACIRQALLDGWDAAVGAMCSEGRGQSADGPADAGSGLNPPESQD